MDAVRFLRRITEHPRAWRAIVALAFVIPILLVLPHARSLVVRNAVITSYLSDFRAPIDGEVVAIHLGPGDLPAEGQAVLTLRNPRVDQSGLARLEVLAEAADEEVGHLELTLKSLRALATERSGQTLGYGKAIERDLQVRKRQLTEDQQAWDVALIAAESGMERVRNLHREGLASPSDLEEAEARFEAARARQEANRQALSRLEHQWGELEQGIYQVGEQDGALFSRQMEQQLMLRQFEAEQALRAAETERRATRVEFEQARGTIDRRVTADIVLPEGKSIFDIYTSKGAWVAAGTRLLSAVACERLMVDIAIDDALLQLIEPGQKVSVRIFGSLRRLPATVALVRGSAALDDTPVLAATVPDRGARKGRVLARIDEGEWPGLAAKTCDIGRAAYAEFEDIGLFTLLFYPLFR